MDHEQNAERGKSDIDFILFELLVEVLGEVTQSTLGIERFASLSKNNDGKDGNMNSTTEIPERAGVWRNKIMDQFETGKSGEFNMTRTKTPTILS